MLRAGPLASSVGRLASRLISTPVELSSAEVSARLAVGSAYLVGSTAGPIVELRRGDAALDVDALCVLFNEMRHDDAPESDE